MSQRPSLSWARSRMRCRGWSARSSSRGHEVASKGYFHHSISHFSREEFRDDVVRSREALEKASDGKVYGFRIGHQWFVPDRSVGARRSRRGGLRLRLERTATVSGGTPASGWRRRPHRHRCGDREIWEFPLASWSIAGWSLPISGGNYFRQLPHSLVRRAVDSWVKRADAPFLMYFHVWELDPDQPRILAAPWTQRVRQYRHLQKMPEIVRYYLGKYRFQGIADHLGLPHSCQCCDGRMP